VPTSGAVSFAMYTVPARVSVHAKTLISAFENGEVTSLNGETVDDSKPSQVGRLSVSQDELAQPGTARQLLLAYEAKRQDSVTSPTAKSPRISRLTASGNKVTDASSSTATTRLRTVLFVSATKSQTDLDHILRDVTVSTLTEAGYDVIITDTYNISRDEYGQRDIAEERNKLMRAHLVLFHYRPVLNSLPGALKLWLDDVLTDSDGQLIELPVFRGKKCIILLSIDGPTNDLTADSVYLSHIQERVMRFVGLDVLPAEVFRIGQGQSSAESSGPTSNVGQINDTLVKNWLERLATL